MRFHLINIICFVILNSSCLFAPASLAAINKVGNGGDGVFCTTPDKRDGQLLDFYESNTNLKSEGKSAETIAAEQIAKLKQVAPKLFEQYTRRLGEMKNEMEYRSEVELTDIPDSYHAFQPVAKDCMVLQVAIRRITIIDGEKRFLIRADLWNRLSSVNQAGLLTHEIIYEHLAKLGETDSIKARKINSYLYRENAGSDSQEFWRMIRGLKVSIYP